MSHLSSFHIIWTFTSWSWNLLRRGKYSNVWSFNTLNVSDTACCTTSGNTGGCSLNRDKKKSNLGILPLWAQLEKGQREQWNNCACVGAVHRELLSNRSKGGKIISWKVSFLFFFLPSHEAIYWRQRELWVPDVRDRKSDKYTYTAQHTGSEKCQCQGWEYIKIKWLK